jgi:hypothetical protein
LPERVVDVARARTADRRRIHAATLIESKGRPRITQRIARGIVRLVTIGPQTGDKRIVSDAFVCDKKGTPEEKLPHLLIHSASTTHGDSGAPIIDETTQHVVAINIGWFQSKSMAGSTRFDCRQNYNRAVLIDESVRQMLKSRSIDEGAT